MKKTLLTFVLLVPFFIFAQEFLCNNTGMTIGKESYHTCKTTMTGNEAPLVINTFFYDVHDGDTILTENDYLEAIAYLNCTFNEFNMFFKYRGFVYEPESTPNDVVPFDNMLNIIIEGTYGGASSAGSITPTVGFQHIISYRKSALAHEIGHSFGLLHTFTGTDDRELLDFIDPPLCSFDDEDRLRGAFPIHNPNANSEHVTRDVNNVDDYNADVAGDHVVDTPATYKRPNRCFRYQPEPGHCDEDSTDSNMLYLYSSEVVDEIGEPYVDIDLANIMSYTLDKYQFRLTTGQGIRMRETILNFSSLSNTLTTIESLYEPYTGEYFFAGPNLPEHRILFQPGFNYNFIQCNGDYNTPSAYDDVSFYYTNSHILKIDRSSLELNDITHPNYSAIRIEQIANQPRKCYKNYNRSASGGEIIKYIDGVPNTNVNITPKTETEINDANLIQNLENGLYTIKKMYDDGTEEQNMILKQN